MSAAEQERAALEAARRWDGERSEFLNSQREVGRVWLACGGVAGARLAACPVAVVDILDRGAGPSGAAAPQA